MSKFLILSAICLLAGFVSFAQETKAVRTVTIKPSEKLPGNIKLLPGYVHKRGQGIDTAVGTISKENGMVIRYDIGAMAGNGLNNVPVDEIMWERWQEVNGLWFHVRLRKNGKINAVFTKLHANFYAETKTQEDVVDFMLMILTYNPEINGK